MKSNKYQRNSFRSYAEMRDEQLNEFFGNFVKKAGNALNMAGQAAGRFVHNMRTPPGNNGRSGGVEQRGNSTVIKAMPGENFEKKLKEAETMSKEKGGEVILLFNKMKVVYQNGQIMHNLSKLK